MIVWFIVLILWWEWPLFSSTFWPVPSVGLDRYSGWQDLYMVTFPSYDLQRSRSGRHYVMVCVWVREREGCKKYFSSSKSSSPYFFLFLYPPPLSLSLSFWSYDLIFKNFSLTFEVVHDNTESRHEPPLARCRNHLRYLQNKQTASCRNRKLSTARHRTGWR